MSRCDLDVLPLNLERSSVMWSNSVLNLSEIERFEAEFHRFKDGHFVGLPPS